MHEKRYKELVNCDSAGKILSDLICQKRLSMGVIIVGTDYNKVSFKKLHFYFTFSKTMLFRTRVSMSSMMMGQDFVEM